MDIFVEADDRELVIIELQFYGQDDYFKRMLYGVSKSVAEHLRQGDPYSNVRKVYSVNIVYFDLGEGDDYIYHGTTVFMGLHTKGALQLNIKQRQLYGASSIGDLYPEYYIIKVGKFNDIAEDTLDEWIYYLKNNRIRDDFTAHGIDKAREILAYEKLSEEERREHDRLVEENRNRESEIQTAFTDGEFKGRTEGEVIGIAKGEVIGEQKKALIIAENLLKNGVSVEIVSNSTGLSIEQIKEIQKNLKNE